MKMTKKKRKNLNKKKIQKKARILKIQPTKKKPQKMMKTLFWEKKKLPLALSQLVKKNKKLSILKKEAPALILIIILYLKLHLKRLWTISQKKGIVGQ